MCIPVSRHAAPSVTKVNVREKTAVACANFRYDLERSELPSVLDKLDVNNAANEFVSHLSGLFNKHFPIKSIRLRSNDKPWVKLSLKLLINKRDFAYVYNKGQTAKYLRLRKTVIDHIVSLK